MGSPERAGHGPAALSERSFHRRCALRYIIIDHLPFSKQERMQPFSRFLVYFLAVARHRSIRKAAESLHIAGSAINRHILLGEKQLQTPLFERLPSGMRLTAAGELLYGCARRWVKDLDDLCGRPVRCNGSHLLSLCVSLNLVFSVECIAARRMRGSGQVRPYVRPVCATFFAGHYGCALACQAPILKTCSMAHVIQRYRLNCS